jgi:hypothetical protein
MMMVENGDEEETTFLDNVMIKSVPLFLGLADDQTPAGYWAPTGNVIWRNNIAYKCAFGYRYNPKGDNAGL